jgi:hypothetical protein
MRWMTRFRLHAMPAEAQRREIGCEGWTRFRLHDGGFSWKSLIARQSGIGFFTLYLSWRINELK